MHANPDGTFAIPNVPEDEGFFRVRVLCQNDDGTITQGQSQFLSLQSSGESIDINDITFGQVDPVPASIEIKPATATVTRKDETFQLQAEATLPGGGKKDVTSPTQGTLWRSSNPGIASVTADGLVTARKRGQVIIQLQNEGVLASRKIAVLIPNDADSDGLPDEFERANGLDPNNPADAGLDSDSDGLTNLQEFQRGTSPRAADTDGDGLTDGNEITRGTNPTKADSDNDGLLDGDEVTRGTNPTNADSDGDHVLDGVEVALGLDPKVVNPTTTITGRVVMPDGGAAEGAAVTAFGQFTAITTAGGGFTLPNVPAGLGAVTVFARLIQAGKAFDGLSAPTTPTAGGTTDVGTIQLIAVVGRVSGTVFSPSGMPAPRARVTVTSGADTRSTNADANGVYQIDQMPAGNVLVEVIDPQTGLRGEASGTLAEGQSLLLDVRLTAAGTISGTVFGRDGTTAVGAGVRVSLLNLSGSILRTSSTNQAGQYRFGFVSLGQYVIEASDTNDNRGRTMTLVSATSQTVTADITFLGRGTVTGVVETEAGTPVNGAAVTLKSMSVFGGEAETTTGALGEFRFDNVFVGSVMVSAQDPISRLGGFANSTIDVEGDTANVTIVLTPSATLTGTLFKADGTTPVPGGVVTVIPSGRTTTADNAGVYRFEFLPLGSYTLDVTDQFDGDRGRTLTALMTRDTTVTTNVALNGLGTVNVTVVGGDGRPVPTAQVTLTSQTIFGGALHGTTNTAGVAAFPLVLAGPFSVTALDLMTQRGGAIGGSVQVGDTVNVTVMLEAAGDILGRVFIADGTTPAPNIQVRLTPLNQTFTTTADGTFRFDRVPLARSPYTVEAIDANGGIRATASGIVLTTNGQQITQDLVLTPEGTVTGTVLNPDGSPARGASVILDSSVPGLRDLQGITDSSGTYTITNVPAGAFTIMASIPALNFAGTNTGTLTTSGQTVTVNVQMQANQPPSGPTVARFFDASAFEFGIQQNGAIQDGTAAVYRGDSGMNRGGLRLELLQNGTSTPFISSSSGFEDNSREVVLPGNGPAGLRVQRKVFVPQNGYFARYLEVLSNPTANPVTVDVRVDSHFRFALKPVENDPRGNVIPIAPRIPLTSSGDDILLVTGSVPDRWVVVDDDVDADPFLDTAPAIAGPSLTQVAHVFGGPGGLLAANAASFSVDDIARFGKLRLEWNSIVVPPGETVILMHFAAQQTSRAAAQASAERLVQLPPEALAGLSADERIRISNFTVPVNGVSTLSVLPALDGTASGTVFAGNGMTPIPAATVRFRSSNALFGRTHSVTTNAGGLYSLQSLFDNSVNTIAVPRDAFTVEATDPITKVLSGPMAGDFAGQATTTRDIVFSTTGLISGLVRRQDGPVASTGMVTLSGGALVNSVSVPIAVDGRYRITGVPPGTYTLVATLPNPQGTGLAGVVSATVVAGQELIVNITAAPAGSVEGTVRVGGNPAVNVAVTLQGNNFSRSTRTDTAGRFTFSDVPIGAYTLTASDPNTGTIAASVQVMVVADQVTTQDLTLAVGTVTGTVFRVDGTTPAVGVQITLSRSGFSATLTTDAQGRFTFSLVPLGSFTLNALDPATGDRGRATTQLTTSGEIRTVNFSLRGLGQVVVNVRNAANQTVANAQVTLNQELGGSHAGITHVDGTVTFTQVVAGTFSVSAIDPVTGLSGSANGSVTAGGSTTVNVQLAASGAIEGTVFAVDGETPVPGAQLHLYSGCGFLGCAYSNSMTADSQGRFHFEPLPLSRTFTLDTRDSGGRLRSRKTIGPLTVNGQIITQDVIFIGLGTVRGVVRNPSSTPVANVTVSLRSMNSEIGGTVNVQTGGDGRYVVTNVPVGSFIATAGIPAQQLQGETFGHLDQDGQEVTADIQLLNNGITLPTNRYDANNYFFDIQRNGSVLSGTCGVYSHFNPTAEDGAFLLDLIVAGVPTRFTGGNVGTIEENGREVLIRQPNLAGLDVIRKIFVPREGYFARYLETLTNPTSNPITVNVRVQTKIDDNASVISTSSGDSTLDIADPANPDRWVVIDDPTSAGLVSSGCDLRLAFTFDGPDAAERAATVSFTSPTSSTRQLVYQWNQITIPPGGTVSYLYFAVQQISRAAAQASAERLVQLPPEALIGLSQDEISQTRNFAIPADGISTVTPLPAVIGAIAGRTLEGDGTTPTPGTNLTFKSSNILYGRTYSFTSDANGVFTLNSQFNDSGSSIVVPIDTFTLNAIHPRNANVRPSIIGNFPAGQATVTQDVIFTGTGIIRGTVRRHTGVTVTSGSVCCSGPSAGSLIASDGSYMLGGVQPGNKSFTAFISHPQGRELQGTVTTTVSAGQTTIADITIQPTGTITGITSDGLGNPTANVSVCLKLSSASGCDSSSRYRQTTTDANGRYTFTDVAVGNYVMEYFKRTGPGSSSGFPIRLSLSVIQDQTIDLSAVIRVQVNFANGNPAPNVFMQLRETALGSSFRVAGTTDADGRLTIIDTGVGSFTLRALHPSDSAIFRDAAGTLSSVDEAVSVNMTLPALATVRVTVSMGNVPFVGARIQIRDSFRQTFRNVGSTDVNGVLSIDRVPEGTFTVQARDPSTNAVIGSVTGTVRAVDDGLTVNVTINLSGTVQGTVVAADGQTPVRSARVEIFDVATGNLLATRFTDSAGFYQANGVAPGSQGFRVRAQAPTDSTVTAEQTGNFTTLGQPLTINLTLAVSVVKGTVFFSDNITPVPFPDVFITQTDTDGNAETFFTNSTSDTGQYTVVGVGIGNFTVTAQDFDSGLSGTASGTLVVVTVPVTVDVRLQPSGIVTGTVLDANNNVVPFADVALSRAGFDRFTTADDQGVYQFDLVALDSFVVQGCDFNESGLCGSAAGALTTEGETVTVDIHLPATGTVRGTVFASDGTTPVADAEVFIENFANNGPLGFFQLFLVTNANGNYEATGIPIGTVRVIANSPDNFSVAGIAEGNLVAGATTTIDVILGNAALFTFNLDGGDGFRYDIRCDGSLRDGGTVDRSLDDAYDGSYFVSVNGQFFPCVDSGLLEDNGREIVIGPATLGGLNAARKIFVPLVGGFARYLEILSNPTAAPIAVSVEIESNLGSDSSTRIVVAPSATSNTFAVTDQEGLCCDPALAHCFNGPNAAVTVGATQFQDGNDDISYSWNVTVPAGQTVILMHFAVQRDLTDTAGAQTQAEALVNLTDGNTLLGMSAEERAAVVNFAIP